jgi:hypothetical protein
MEEIKTKLELPKITRMKRMENYVELAKIEAEISKRIRAEYTDEINALRGENEKLLDEERDFYVSVSSLLKNVDTSTKLKVVTQTGKDSDFFRTYVGHIERRVGVFDKSFDFVSPDAYEGRPFTIGFSCLQSIEILTEE